MGASPRLATPQLLLPCIPANHFRRILFHVRNLVPSWSSANFTGNILVRQERSTVPSTRLFNIPRIVFSLQRLLRTFPLYSTNDLAPVSVSIYPTISLFLAFFSPSPSSSSSAERIRLIVLAPFLQLLSFDGRKCWGRLFLSRFYRSIKYTLCSSCSSFLYHEI